MSAGFWVVPLDLRERAINRGLVPIKGPSVPVAVSQVPLVSASLPPLGLLSRFHSTGLGVHPRI